MQKFIHTNNSLKNLIFENTNQSVIKKHDKINTDANVKKIIFKSVDDENSGGGSGGGSGGTSSTSSTSDGTSGGGSGGTSSTSGGADKLQNVIKDELNIEKSDDSLETKQKKFITILINEYNHLSNENKENFTNNFIEIYLRKFIESLKLTNKKFFIITNNLLFRSSYDNYNDSFFTFILQKIDLNNNNNNNYTKLCDYFGALIKTFMAKQNLEKQKKEEQENNKSDLLINIKYKIIKKRVIISDLIENNISKFNNSKIGKLFDSEIKIKELYDFIFSEENVISNNKINIDILFKNLLKKYEKLKLFKLEDARVINDKIKNKINDFTEELGNRKKKKIQYKETLFNAISSITDLNNDEIIYLFENIDKLNENKNFSFNNFGKLIAITKKSFNNTENIIIDLKTFKAIKDTKFYDYTEERIKQLKDLIKFQWHIYALVSFCETVCLSILDMKDIFKELNIKILGELYNPDFKNKNASVVSSVLSSKIKTKLGKDKRDITDQDIQRELEESVADICLGILRMYDGETYNKYQKSIDDDIVAQYNQGNSWYKRGFEKLFNVDDVTKRVRHETTHKTSEQVKTRLLQQEVKKIIEAFIALTKTVKPDLQQDHKLFTGNIINENNLIYKQFKLLIEQEIYESQEKAEEQETDESTEQETDDTKSDYKISVAKLKQVLQANGVLIYGKSAQNIDAKTRKESEHYMLEMFSSFLSINFDIEVTGVKKYKYDDLIRDQIIAAGNINTQPKEGQVASERIEKLTQGSGLPTNIDDITLQQLVSLLNDAGKSDQLVRVLTTPEQNREEILKEIIAQPATQQQFLKARRGLPNLSKRITDILFNHSNVQNIKDKLTNYEFKDDKFNIDELQKFFNIIEGSIKFDHILENNFIEFTKQFLHIKSVSHENYDEFVRDEIGCNILNKVFDKAGMTDKKISTGFIKKLEKCNFEDRLIKLVGDTVYKDKIQKKSDNTVDIVQTKNAIKTKFEEDTKLDDIELTTESKKMSSGLILREGVRVSSVDEVMREFGELKREFRNIYRY